MKSQIFNTGTIYGTRNSKSLNPIISCCCHTSLTTELQQCFIIYWCCCHTSLTTELQQWFILYQNYFKQYFYLNKLVIGATMVNKLIICCCGLNTRVANQPWQLCNEIKHPHHHMYQIKHPHNSQLNIIMKSCKSNKSHMYQINYHMYQINWFSSYFNLSFLLLISINYKGEHNNVKCQLS